MTAHQAPVSVVIPIYNAAHSVETQVWAVTAQMGQGDELVLVDNRSTDSTLQVVRRLCALSSQIRVVEARAAQGVAHARNVGLKAAQHDLLLICDADDRIRPGWVEAMRTALGSCDLAGGLLVKVSELPSTTHASDVPEVSPRNDSVLGLGRIFGHWAYPVGANMACHRRVLQCIGGFDESFVGGHEEVDFAWRAQDAGFTVQEVTDAVVDYVERAIPRAQARRYRQYARTSIQLWCRHRCKVEEYAVSFRGAVCALAQALPLGVLLAVGRGDLASAQRWGWAVGLVEGHVRYRYLGQLPPPHIPKYM